MEAWRVAYLPHHEQQSVPKFRQWHGTSWRFTVLRPTRLVYIARFFLIVTCTVLRPGYESRAASESPCSSSSELESIKDPRRVVVQPYNTDFVREFCDLYTEIVKSGLEALSLYWNTGMWQIFVT